MNRNDLSTSSADRQLTENSDTGMMHDTEGCIGEGGLGLTNESWQSCSEFADVFFKCLEFGRVRGIVIIASGHKPEAGFIPLAQELVKRDILVAISGGVAEDVEKSGLMEIEFSDETNAGLLELCNHIGINPVIHMSSRADHVDMLDFYTGQAGLASADIKDLPWAAITTSSIQGSKTFSSDLEQICDTIFSLEADPAASADLLDDYIHEKRLKLEWGDRFHCSEETYS